MHFKHKRKQLPWRGDNTGESCDCSILPYGGSSVGSSGRNVAYWLSPRARPTSETLSPRCSGWSLSCFAPETGQNSNVVQNVIIGNQGLIHCACTDLFMCFRPVFAQNLRLKVVVLCGPNNFVTHFLQATSKSNIDQIAILCSQDG